MDVGPLVLKLTHVALAMVLVAGMTGRWVLLRRAATGDDVEEAARLAELAGPFERMVVTSSMLVLPAGLATAWAQGYEWLGLTTLWMLASVAIYVAATLLVPTVFLPRGRAFAAALNEARTFEVVGIAVIVALMVMKPTL